MAAVALRAQKKGGPKGPPLVELLVSMNCFSRF